ncbi:MAG TPA: hypothetical protein VFW95_05940 [Candidatus Limnocylindria bacterium]|nr:hypothetical protein [Candidatus Limnocylindria bacterium]
MLAFGIEITTDQIADDAITTPKLADGAVTNGKLADMAQGLLKGRAAGAGTGDPQDLTATQVKAILDLQASEVDYSNVTSGLVATTVQDAIDELDSMLDALGNGMVFQGTFDAGGGAGPVNFPGAGAAQAGWFYHVINAAAGGTTVGTSNPLVVHTGDQLVAATDNASATNGADWIKLDNTDSVTSVAGKVGAVLLEAPDIGSVPTDRLLGRDTAGTGATEHISVGGGIEFGGAANLQRSALTGDVTAAAGSNATTIAADVVDNTKLADMAQGLIKGRASGAGTGDPTDLTGAQVKTILGQMQTADIADDAVTFAKMQNIATDRLIGRDTAGTGDPEQIALAGDVQFDGAGNIRLGVFSGDVTKSAGSLSTIINGFAATIAFKGSLTPATLGSDQNNYNPSDLDITTVLRLTASTPVNITGIVPTALFSQTGGRWLYVQNIGSNAITLVNESASSTAANRFALPGNVILNANESIFLIYDGGASRWRAADDKTKTLTGDVTGAGAYSLATTIANDAVTFAKMQNLNTDRLLGRDTAGTGDPEEIAVGGGLEFGGAANIQRSALTGDVTAPAGSNATTLVQGSSTFALTGDITPPQITASQNNYNPTGLSTASVLRLSTDSLRNITGIAGGADGRLLFLHNVGAFNIRLDDESASSTAANRFALTTNLIISPDEVVLLQYDSTTQRWREVAGRTTTLQGDVTGTGNGTFTATIANDAVTNAKLANMATATIKGRTTAGTGDPEDLTTAQVITMLGLDTAMEFRGNFDAGGTVGPVNFPGSGTEEAGGTYAVTNANANGTVLGTSNALTVYTGDLLVARQDNASATDGAHWFVHSGNRATDLIAKSSVSVLNGGMSIASTGIPSLNYTASTASDADGDVLAGAGRASANFFAGLNVGSGPSSPFNVSTLHTTGALYAVHDSNVGIGHGAVSYDWASRLVFAVNPGQGHPSFSLPIAASIPVPALVVFSDGDVAIDPEGLFDGVGATQPMPKGGDLILKPGFRVGPDGGGQFAPADHVEFKEFNLRVSASQTDIAAIYGAVATAAGDMLAAFDGWVVGIAAYAIDALPAGATIDLDLWVNGANEGATLTLQLTNGAPAGRTILTPATYFELTALDKISVRGTSNASVSANTDVQIELIVMQRLTVGSVDP